MHDPVERFFTVPAGPGRAKFFELLIRVLTAAVTVVGPLWRSTRSHAGFVADQVRCRTAGANTYALTDAGRSRLTGLHVVDPVDEHMATAIRDVPRALPPPLTHLEVLAGEDVYGVVGQVIALGRPDALTSPAPGSWSRPRPEDHAYVDDRRMAAALRLLDDEGIELVRKSS